jgi:hypothetical protein
MLPAGVLAGFVVLARLTAPALLALTAPLLLAAALLLLQLLLCFLLLLLLLLSLLLRVGHLGFFHRCCSFRDGCAGTRQPMLIDRCREINLTQRRRHAARQGKLLPA